MKKAIAEFIIKFLLDKFAIEAKAETGMDCVNEEQLEQLLKALNEEFKIELRLNDILWYIKTYSLNLEDLSSVIFNKIVVGG